MDPDEALERDAVGQAELVADGTVTASQLLEAAIARIEERDGDLHAVRHTRFEAARAEVAGGLPDGRFRGVPLLVKDALCEIAGEPSWAGMRLLAEHDHRAAVDSFLAARYRRAGFVLLGRTSLPELALSATTEPDGLPAKRNPWDPERSAGGSSGGSAAAVAARMVAAAHGNDMAGSIRIPASWCGLVGLKPSRARTSIGPAFGEYWGQMTHEHVLCRSVRDAAAVLDAVAGPAPGDPYTAPPPQRPWLDEVGAEPGRLRVGVARSLPDGTPLGAEASAAVDRAAGALTARGHEVVDDRPDALADPACGAAYLTVLTTHVAGELARVGGLLGVEVGEQDVEPSTWAMAEHGRGVSAVELTTATHTLQRWARSCVSWWRGGGPDEERVGGRSAGDGFDLLLTPTVPTAAPRLGEVEGLQAIPFTMPFNVTGQPAISLPLHHTDEGLPFGVQLVAAPWREDLLLSVASQLERALPWHDHQPGASRR